MQIACSIIAVVGVLLLVLPFIFQGFTQEGWREFFSHLPTILLLLSAGIGGLLLMPHFRRRAHLYDAAFSSSPLDNAPMATNQPLSNEMALALPTTIRLRIRWSAALVWHMLFLLVVEDVADPLSGAVKMIQAGKIG